jgi:hypothetical protein
MVWHPLSADATAHELARQELLLVAEESLRICFTKAILV